MTKIMKALAETDARAKKYVGIVYDRTIDRGAHPNMLSVFTLVRRGRGKNTFTFSYQTTDNRVIRSSVYDTVHTGLAALTLICVTLPDEIDTPSLRKSIMLINKSSGAITRRRSRPVTPAIAATVSRTRKRPTRKRRASAPGG
jgi:hypothetical protein